MKILILNGPNLNLQGRRDVAVYGSTAFEEYLTRLRAVFPDVGLDCFQSNVEGELIDALHRSEGRYDGVVFNGARGVPPRVAAGARRAGVDHGFRSRLLPSGGRGTSFAEIIENRQRNTIAMKRNIILLLIYLLMKAFAYDACAQHDTIRIPWRQLVPNHSSHNPNINNRILYIIPTIYVQDTVEVVATVRLHFANNLRDKTKQVDINTCRLQVLEVNSKTERKYITIWDKDKWENDTHIRNIWNTCNNIIIYLYLNQDYSEAAMREMDPTQSIEVNMETPLHDLGYTRRYLLVPLS